MTTTLTQQYKNQLEQWVTPDKGLQFNLLYKATRDGCSNTAFHNTCDNKGPTITVFYNTNNTVYGGYTSAHWSSDDAYGHDTKAFLFRLAYNGILDPLRFQVKEAQYATFGHMSYGPMFGGGYHSFNGTINKHGNCFPLNGALNVGHYYEMNGVDSNTLCNGHQNVLDIEVYSVTEVEKVQTPVKNEISENPQKNNIEWNSTTFQTLKEYAIEYRPLEGLKIKKSKILLIGQVGAGKSSFFNTINSIFRGYVSCQANMGSSEHSLTTVLRTYQIRNSSNEGKSLSFKLCDTRGLEEDQGLEAQELDYVLDGHVPSGYQFNPAVQISSSIPNYVKNPELGDKIHCIVFVVDGSAVDVIPEKVLDRIRNMQTKINQKGIPQVVLLTKIDKLCLMVADDTSKVFSSEVVKECICKVSQTLGLPRAHVLPIKNYESEDELDENVNILALRSLKKILNSVNDNLYNALDEIEEDSEKEGTK